MINSRILFTKYIHCKVNTFLRLLFDHIFDIGLGYASLRMSRDVYNFAFFATIVHI